MSTEAEHPHANAEVDGTEADKINTGALGTLIAVGLFAMLSITAAVTALVRHDLQEEEAIKDQDANAVVVGLKKSQHAALEAPASYLDKAKGTVALPIDLAQNLVLKELERDPSLATPPAKASAEPAAVAPPADSGKVDDKKAPEATDGKKALETGREVKAPQGAPKTPVPTPTPTAATPGAEAPGPTNK